MKKAQQKKDHLNYGDIEIRANFSTETMWARRERNKIFKILKKKINSAIPESNLVTLFFKTGILKTFWDKNNRSLLPLNPELVNVNFLNILENVIDCHSGKKITNILSTRETHFIKTQV